MIANRTGRSISIVKNTARPPPGAVSTQDTSATCSRNGVAKVAISSNAGSTSGANRTTGSSIPGSGRACRPAWSSASNCRPASIATPASSPSGAHGLPATPRSRRPHLRTPTYASATRQASTPACASSLDSRAESDATERLLIPELRGRRRRGPRR